MRFEGPRRSHTVNWRGERHARRLRASSSQYHRFLRRRSTAESGKEEAGRDGKPTGRTPQLENLGYGNRRSCGCPLEQHCANAAGVLSGTKTGRMENPRGTGEAREKLD
eukprot:9988574-Heterocapsa_arctica.AAC.2